MTYEYELERKFFLEKYKTFLFMLKTKDTYCGDIQKGAVSLDVQSCKNYDTLEPDQLIVKKRENITILDNAWAAHYLTAYEIWKDHKLIGAGNKSFRYLCGNYDNINSKRKDIRCSTHPHNIYLEVLSEFGIIGLILFLSFILIIFYKSIKNFIIIFKDKSINFKENYKFEYSLYIGTFILFIILIWPIKSTGRLSSTFYGSLFWIYIFLMCVKL